MDKKEQAYKELCELGKLGVLKNYPDCFRKLERLELSEIENNPITVSEIVDMVQI